MGKLEYLQQGDVLFTKCKELPKTTKINRSPVIQLGEATGHAHRYEGNARIHEVRNWNNTILVDRYLEVRKPVWIKHEEHKPLRLLKGVYRIGIVQEYDHFAKVTRIVRD